MPQRSGLALVIGNDEYKSGKLATPANDAGLVADALTAAGFTVTGARNLDQATLRETFREFLGQVAAAGPDAVTLVYLAGYGVQFAGENYFVPVDADIARDVDVPLQAIRVSDFMQPLAALPGPVKIVILDAARQNPFARDGEPLASGLALVDPGNGIAIAFNAAPGTVGPDEAGPYGAYATVADGNDRCRRSQSRRFVRAHALAGERTDKRRGGALVRIADRAAVLYHRARRRRAERRRMRRRSPICATSRCAVIRASRMPMRRRSRSTRWKATSNFWRFILPVPFSQRIAAMLAVRREEIIWRHCVFNNTPPAYWSYLRRYPRGPHAWDARRRLAMLGAPFEGPADFAFVDFGVPPPPPDELDFVDRPVVMFWGPGFAPPPRPPVFFLPPRPREFVVLPPPPPPRERFFLPTPGAAVVPAFVRPPRTVAVRPATSGAPSGPTPVALPRGVVPRCDRHAAGNSGCRCAFDRSREAGCSAAPAACFRPGAGDRKTCDASATAAASFRSGTGDCQTCDASA